MLNILVQLDGKIEILDYPHFKYWRAKFSNFQHKLTNYLIASRVPGVALGIFKNRILKKIDF